MTVTVLFSATTAPGSIDAPSGPMRRITSGETGSLNVKLSTAGATGTTAPSAGDAFTSEACAYASLASASAINNAMKQATAALPRLVMPADYIFGSSFKAGAGSGYSLAGLPAAGISIQRWTPFSHSCTTGKYSSLPASRSPARKPVNTNSS